MHTQLATQPVRPEHPPHTVHSPEPHPVRRVGLLDRTALHIGVALIKWGRRPVRAESREQHTVRLEALRARAERQREYELLRANISRIL
jgi:hypothetical protein